MRKFVFASVPDMGNSSASIDRSVQGTYWRLPSDDIWRICIVKQMDGQWAVWSKGHAVHFDPALEELNQLALTFHALTGEAEGFAHELEIDL